MKYLIVLACLFLFSCDNGDEKNLKPYRVKYIYSLEGEIDVVCLDSNHRVGDVVDVGPFLSKRAVIVK